MSGAAEDVKLSLKVMINKQKTKVLFAEADSDFVDVLLSFLTLPLGTIVRILEKHYGDEAPVIGSLTTLYNGLSNLDSAYFRTEGGKQMLLNPRNSFETECRKLKLDISDTQPAKYFCCENLNCGYFRHKNIGLYYGTCRCRCGQTLRDEIRVNESSKNDGDAGVFSIKRASFIICDNLRMVPNVAGSVLETLSNLGITDPIGAELKNVTFGFNEIMGLLKGSFLSETPLTDMIIPKERQNIDSVKPKSEPKVLLHPVEEEANSDNPKKRILKLMVQKSTNKLLFAQAKKDFVDFLFGLLTIPLGGVESLLGSNTCLKNIDNLYGSLANYNCEKYLKTKDTKTKLLEPKIPYGYMSRNQILPLTQESKPLLYYIETSEYANEFLCPSPMNLRSKVCSYKSPSGYGSYVEGLRMYMVTDDLTVTPLCMTSSLSFLNGLEIPLSDVKEVELHIGLEEALRILKASLTSTRALTDSLIIPPQPSLKKCLKQEK